MISAAAMVLVPSVVQTYHPHESPAATDAAAHDRALRKKPSTANSMLTKFFSRSAAASSGKGTDLENMSEELDETIGFELNSLITPCPYLNPLKHKLEPRTEQIRLCLPPATPPSGKSDASISPITIARHRGETNRLL